MPHRDELRGWKKFRKELKAMSEKVSEREGLHVTSFYGGQDRGLCLAFDTAHSVAELKAVDVAALVDELTRWLDQTPFHRPGHDRRQAT